MGFSTGAFSLSSSWAVIVARGSSQSSKTWSWNRVLCRWTAWEAAAHARATFRGPLTFCTELEEAPAVS
jgi:hypothetical protein